MIYLASASPRRRELLRQLGVTFKAMPSNIHEVRRAGESPTAYVTRVAADKARFVARVIAERGLPEAPVLGADTEVILDGAILGKPRNRAHGMEMLQQLAGRTHNVLTAMTLVYHGQEHSALSTSTVTFGALTQDEIERYWDSGEPLDKAGAYAIQGAAAGFIARVEGSYSGVMGLPLFELTQLLKKINGSAA